LTVPFCENYSKFTWDYSNWNKRLNLRWIPKNKNFVKWLAQLRCWTTIMQLYAFITNNKCLKLIRRNLSFHQGGISSSSIPWQHCFILYLEEMSLTKCPEKHNSMTPIENEQNMSHNIELTQDSLAFFTSHWWLLQTLS